MITIKSQREIDLIRDACKIVAESLLLVEEVLKPGIKTIELDQIVKEFIKKSGGKAAFKNFNGYPANICVSIDEQVVHGIPGNRQIESGQIVSVDIGVKLNNYFGDSAKTFAVGEISEEKKQLLEVTNQSLYRGIDAAVEGNRLSDISHSIQTFVEKNSYSVVRELVGHGIGSELHEEPQIPNYGKPNRGPRLRSGMVLAIEPMVNLGSYQVVTADDGWTVSTRDGSPSAHFEHTIVVQNSGPEILTKLKE